MAISRDSLGWILFISGHVNDAVPQLEKAVTLLPYDPTLNDHLGDAYWQIGRRLDAKYEWQRASAASKNATQKAILQQKIDNGPPLHPATKLGMGASPPPPSGLPTIQPGK